MATFPLIHPNQAPRTNSIGGIPVREDVLFTDAKGNEKSALRNTAEKALDKLKVVLPKMLEPGETVLYIAPAMAPLSIWEQLFLGWYTLHLKGVTLLLTDRRLLRFRRKAKGWRDWEWTRGVQAARWGDIAELKVKGWLTRTLAIKYRDGKKENYQISGFGPGKKMKTVIRALFPAEGGTLGAASGQDMVSLCPECVKPLTPRVYQCSSCGTKFKNEMTLFWRNFFVPGGAYFYTGFTGLGILQAIADVGLVVEVVTWGLVALRVTAPPAPPRGEAPKTSQYAAMIAGYVFAIFLLENLISWVHTRKLVRDFIPEH